MPLKIPKQHGELLKAVATLEHGPKGVEVLTVRELFTG